MAATALISSRRRMRGDAPVSWDSNGLRRVQSRRSPGKCQSGGSTTTDSFRILHRDGLFVRYRQSRTYSANETKTAQTKKFDMRTKKPTTDENDFKALDRLAHCVTRAKLRPMTVQHRLRWGAAERATPKKQGAAGKAVPTLIAIESKLLRQIDAYAKRTAISRS